MGCFLSKEGGNQGGSQLPQPQTEQAGQQEQQHQRRSVHREQEPQQRRSTTSEAPPPPPPAAEQQPAREIENGKDGEKQGEGDKPRGCTSERGDWSPSPPQGVVTPQRSTEAKQNGQHPNGDNVDAQEQPQPPQLKPGSPPLGSPFRSRSPDDLANTSRASTETATSAWDRARQTFALTKPEELLDDLHDLKYIGAGGYGKVFKAVWRSAPVAVKLVPSCSPELFKSSSYKEALLCRELCHPNIVQTYETRCAQITDEFVQHVLESDPGQSQQGGSDSASQIQTGASREFVSGDGFGLPSPVPDMVVKGRTLPGAAAKWKDILLTTGAKAGDFLTVIIMDFCDYGSLVRPILKGMFRPVSASGNDREARVRYRALLRTAKEIAQGIEHLHHLRVVHGDLKPGNVLLKGSRVDVRGFNAQVIDFGLSHLVSSSNPQKVSKAGGTLVYAAPEVFSGIVGKAADIYSLGIILWEMTTGSQPYKDLMEGQIVIGVQKNGLRPPWPTDQLPQLQEVYNMCVAQDPEARPKAKQLVQKLTQIEMDLRNQLKEAHTQLQEQQRLRQLQLQQQQPQAQAVVPGLPQIPQQRKSLQQNPADRPDNGSPAQRVGSPAPQ